VVKIWYIQHDNINVLVIFFYQTNTLNVQMLNLQSSFYMNTHSETFTPLVRSIIDDALLKAITSVSSIMNFSEKDPLLDVYANFVVYWVQIWVLEP